MRLAFLSSALWLVSASLSLAQPASPPADPSQATSAAQALVNGLKSEQSAIEWVSANHVRFTGGVEQDIATDTRISADQVEWFLDTNRLVASGNVVFAGPEGRLAADRADFDMASNTGTFYEASGLMSLGAQADRSQFGGQDPDVYFWGNTIEKIGARQYRITRGGFTTCVQPTPRWELVTGSLVINLNDYAIARNTTLRVKGVPLLYLPVLYYPLHEDERATGFLMPMYGRSTIRGQTLSNAFFWAIGRSHDATFMHDWFTKAGQGLGGEYRFIAGPQSSGNFRLYRFNQEETEYTQNGTTTVYPASRSFELSGSAFHALSPNVRARARVDYFTDIVNQQLYHQSVYQASRRNRVLEGGLTAGLGAISTSAFYQRNEAFQNEKDTQVYGSTPRISTSLAPQRLFNGPVYGSMNAEYGFLPYRSVSSGQTISDKSLNRVDVSPTVRMPLSTLTFLSVNTSAAYRTTYYSNSVEPISQRTVDDAYLRQYIAVRSDIVGPVFTRIWDLPESGFAERLKHVIEPAYSADFTSPISDYRRTPILSDSSDFVVGGASRLTYGINNRFFYRGRTVNALRGQTREFVTVGLQQSYYSNPESSQYDNSYQSAYGYRRPSNLSPVALNVRVSPSLRFDGNGRVEYDVSGGGLQVLSAGASLPVNGGSTSVNYSRRRIDKRRPADDFVTGSTSLRWLNGRASGSYSLSWDIGRGYIVSQSVIASYLAQCCGLHVEFQQFSYADSIGFPLPSDRRFNFGFVLAGLGTFSNFFGAFGGQP